MSLRFQIDARSGAARAGRLITPHGEVPTPVFMPVGTQATVKGVPQHILEELGVRILLGNTYHLYLRPGIEQVRKLGGLHGFMSWERAILTDSGGFQVWSLNELRKITEEGVSFRSHLDGSAHLFTPESATAAQIGLGADIIMAFDECTEYPAERERARHSMDMTLRWAQRCKTYFEEHKHERPWSTAGGPRSTAQTNPDDTQALFAIVQGGMHADLRRECAERLVESDFPGYAIGGLSVGEPRHITEEVLQATLPYLPEDKPRYVMGVGTPEEIIKYALLGVDMMDCVLPTRAARHGLLFTSEGKVNIKNQRYAGDDKPLDPNCSCPVCGRYSRAYLRHLYAAGESLATVLNSVHNLHFYVDSMRRIRDAIMFGKLSEFHSGALSSNPGAPRRTPNGE